MEQGDIITSPNRRKYWLKDIQSCHSLIGNIAGKSLHMGIKLVTDQESKEKAIKEADSIMYDCMEKGLAFKTISGNVITLRPSLLIKKMKWIGL